jgi:hypothetical protein
MIPVESDQIYCESCRLTHTIPDLSIPQNTLYWRRLEQAKRRFLYLTQIVEYFHAPKIMMKIAMVYALTSSCKP